MTLEGEGAAVEQVQHPEAAYVELFSRVGDVAAFEQDREDGAKHGPVTAHHRRHPNGQQLLRAFENRLRCTASR